MEKKKGLSLSKVLIMFVLIPLFVSVVVTSTLAIFTAKSSLEDQTFNSLKVASMDLRAYYEYDILNDNNLVDGWVSYEPDYMDHLKSTGVELTLFKGDTRFCTSIIGADGKRIEGTKAGDAVIAEVINNGKEYQSDDVVINGTDYYVYYVPMKDAAGKVVGMAFAGKTCEEVNSVVSSTIIKLLTVAIICVILFVIIALILVRRITKPITICADSIGKIANGDTGVTVNTSSSVRETLQLVSAAKLLQSTLADIIGKTKSISDSLNSESEAISSMSKSSSEGTSQIAFAIQDLAQGASSLADNVQSINQQAITMGQSIETIAANASELSASSSNIRTANADASEYITKVAGSSGKTVDAVQSISKQIEETNEAVEKIKNAVEMISNIADQTNLLALNASIEAARAGDAGRGFAVVASEIGSLSEQSNSSANEIRQIVDDIVVKSAQSVALSTEVAELITEERKYIEETQNKFKVLNQEIDTSVNGINSITQKIDALEEVKNTIISSVSDLSAISEENAASNEEVSASITSIVDAIESMSQSAEHTYSRSKELNETVSYFN